MKILGKREINNLTNRVFCDAERFISCTFCLSCSVVILFFLYNNWLVIRRHVVTFTYRVLTLC